MKAPPVRVLLVEDSASDALLLQESLAETRPGDLAFTHVECWADAAQRLGQEPFDVLLLDLSLPDVSGRETFLRARVEAPHLPIVVLTGEANEDLGLEAVRHGIQDYLIKGQAYGRQTVRAIRYAIERKQVEEALSGPRRRLRESERQLRQWNTELERRVAERTASLAQTISDLEDFSHSITHDLRAPLRAIRSFAQILEEECLACGDPRAQENIERITTRRRAHGQADPGRAAVQSVDAQRASIGAGGPAGVARRNHRKLPAPSAAGVDIRIEGSLPQVLGNEAALTQCFSNLLDNAAKFVAPGIRPQVRIWAEPAGTPKAELRGPKAEQESEAAESGGATVAAPERLPGADEVSGAMRAQPLGSSGSGSPTTGLGIPEEAQAHIFKMFQRLDKSYDGTGVGLTVVRKAVEKMGGRVGLESEPGAREPVLGGTQGGSPSREAAANPGQKAT